MAVCPMLTDDQISKRTEYLRKHLQRLADCFATSYNTEMIRDRLMSDFNAFLQHHQDFQSIIGFDVNCDPFHNKSLHDPIIVHTFIQMQGMTSVHTSWIKTIVGQGVRAKESYNKADAFDRAMKGI